MLELRASIDYYLIRRPSIIRQVYRSRHVLGIGCVSGIKPRVDEEYERRSAMAATHPSSSAQNSLSAGSWWRGILIVLAAVVMNTLIVLAAHAALTVAPTFVPLQFESVIPATVVAVTGALVVFAFISQRSQEPTRLFRRIAVGVLVVSIIPDLLLPVIGVYPGTTFPEVGALLVMHMATALLCIGMAPRLIAARP